MAIEDEFKEVKEFEDWYVGYSIDVNRGVLQVRGHAACSKALNDKFEFYRREHNARTHGYEKYEKQAAAEVTKEIHDLPNVSSGDSAGFINRMARRVVQHTPNVEIMNEFDDDSIQGVLAKHILKTRIIGDDEYSSSMHQNLLTTARRGFTLGFDCVVPALLQKATGDWYMKYDNIHYKDVFEEPGAKDVRQAEDVFVRRYLTKGQIASLIRNQVPGWDVFALRSLLQTAPSTKEFIDHETKKSRSHSTNAYEVITWYNSWGQGFLTFDPRSKNLLRIEKNPHPYKRHPVFYFVPERDENQPLGKSLLSRTYGRQEFQDLFLRGAMKMWIRNIDPPIFGFGGINAMPNLSPGAYNPISNPNAKVEQFEINSMTLNMFGQIAQQNSAGMVQVLGAADQQMASQSTSGMMSQTPQGVDAQQQMVDTTTNDYQKAMEAFFSEYASYALTVWFQEMKGEKKIKLPADVRKSMLDKGLPPEAVEADGSVTIDFKSMATLYFVRVIPGSLVEIEDEKQARLLGEMLVPLSQALPALAQVQDRSVVENATRVMQYIIKKQIELSDSSSASELSEMLINGNTSELDKLTERITMLENALGGEESEVARSADVENSVLLNLIERVSLLAQGQAALGQALGLVAPDAPDAPGGQGALAAGQGDASGAGGPGVSGTAPAPGPGPA